METPTMLGSNLIVVEHHQTAADKIVYKGADHAEANAAAEKAARALLNADAVVYTYQQIASCYADVVIKSRRVGE
jgi:hypothetical protein